VAVVLSLLWVSAVAGAIGDQDRTVSETGSTSTTPAPAPESSTSTATGEPSSTATTAATTKPSASGDPTTTLAGLRVAPEGPRTGYSRDLFPHWVDADGDRCDTREEVLIAESRSTAQVDPFGCKVVAGDWVSLYDGLTFANPSDLDVDHVVALGEAWDSGASGWDLARRRAYANDLDHAQALRAVSASSNRSKGDLDPAQWKPSREPAWCEYARDWVTVKVAWDLTADEDEVADLRVMLRTCRDPGPSSLPPATTSPTTARPAPPPPPPASGTAAITALDCRGETVTVGNGGSSPVDLTGWTVHDEGAKHSFDFPGGYTLSPAASVTIRSGGPAGAGELSWTSQPVWNNEGDTAYLVDPAGNVVFSKSC
jgi:hypothetical protein